MPNVLTQRWDDIIVALYMASVNQEPTKLGTTAKSPLRIQVRVAVNPVFAKTRRVALKTDGIATLQRIKAEVRRRSAGPSKWKIDG